VSALGGDTVAPPSAGIGTIVHAAMEHVPDGDLEAMRRILEERWGELDFETPWIDAKERRRADLYLQRLHDYLAEVRREGGRVVASEGGFRFAVDLAAEPAAHPVDAEKPAQQAIVSGYIDRVEAYPAGGGEHEAARGRSWSTMADGAGGERVVVVDLKTGKYEPGTEALVAEHAQLAAYQLAIEQGQVEDADPAALAGARLVLVAQTIGQSPYRVAHQHRLDDEARAAFLERVAEAGRGMAASSFTAQVEAHCADTQVRISPCRIHTIPAVSA